MLPQLDEAEKMGETSGCQSSILFMTDGQAPDPTAIVNARNSGPYSSNDTQTTNGHCQTCVVCR